jgi:sec-independent protein translocase protein TatC
MLVMACGIMFQLPMIVFVLAKLGVVTPKFLRTYRKHAIVVIFVVAAVLTPPDVTSQIIMSVPLLILYEIGIYVARVVQKKEEIRQQEESF